MKGLRIYAMLLGNFLWAISHQQTDSEEFQFDFLLSARVNRWHFSIKTERAFHDVKAYQRWIREFRQSHSFVFVFPLDSINFVLSSADFFSRTDSKIIFGQTKKISWKGFAFPQRLLVYVYWSMHDKLQHFLCGFRLTIKTVIQCRRCSKEWKFYRSRNLMFIWGDFPFSLLSFR